MDVADAIKLAIQFQLPPSHEGERRRRQHVAVHVDISTPALA